MSDASKRVDTRADPRIDRLQPWIAALGSALLHLLVLLVAILAPTPTMTTPQGASSGSWVQVDFIGETRDADQTPPAPPSGAANDDLADRRTTAPTPPAASRIRSMPVPEAENPVPPDIASLPALRPSTPRPAPSNPRDSALPRQSPTPAAMQAA